MKWWSAVVQFIVGLMCEVAGKSDVWSSENSLKKMWIYILLWNFKLKNNIFYFKVYLIKLILKLKQKIIL